MSDNLTPLQKKLNEWPCPVCGGKQFEWGFAYGGYRRGLMSLGTKVVTIRHCLRCHNLLSFIDEKRSRQVNRRGLAIAIAMIIIMSVFMLLTSPTLRFTLFR